MVVSAPVKGRHRLLMLIDDGMYSVHGRCVAWKRWIVSPQIKVPLCVCVKESAVREVKFLFKFKVKYLYIYIS